MLKQVSVQQSLDAPRMEQSRQQTAKKALGLLEAKGAGYYRPTPEENQNLRVAFAKANMVLYGKAYDIIKKPADLSLLDTAELERRLGEITICEVKSTSKKDVRERFGKFFFSLSTAELLVAQNIGSKFLFVFVNTITGETMECDLEGLYKRARAVYPTWSVQF